jgi:thiamine-phosphate pyrophosphorylase
MVSAVNPTPGQSASELAVYRLLDANLDRAREGLRVLEDWARFGLDRADLVARCKDLRQRLGSCHADRFKLARHAATDPATGMAHPAQAERLSPGQVLAANAGRAQEALRVIEEFARSGEPQLAHEAAAVRYELYDLEVDLLRANLLQSSGAERRQLLQRCHLYLVTSPVPNLVEMVAGALSGGVRLLQYRCKPGATAADGSPLSDAERLQQARQLRQLCARHGALFIVNDRIDLALAVEADGVHLGQEDLPPAVARALLGPERLIGRSTHGLEQIQRAVADGCDYVGVGPVAATPTKPGRQPVGLEAVSNAAAACPIPFFAIGGIDAPGLAAVRAAGATRVAVVRAITEAANPEASARELLAALECEA